MSDAPKSATANSDEAEAKFARRAAGDNVRGDAANIVQAFLVMHPEIEDAAEIRRLVEVVEMALRRERGLV